MPLHDWIMDAQDYNLPRDLKRYDFGPAEFISGERIGWWYGEDERFAKQARLKPAKEDPPYSGIVVPRPDIEVCGRIEADDVVVVMDRYPVEKCYCEATYIAYRRLLDADDLGGVIKIKK